MFYKDHGDKRKLLSNDQLHGGGPGCQYCGKRHSNVYYRDPCNGFCRHGDYMMGGRKFTIA